MLRTPTADTAGGSAAEEKGGGDTKPEVIVTVRDERAAAATATATEPGSFNTIKIFFGFVVVLILAYFVRYIWIYGFILTDEERFVSTVLSDGRLWNPFSISYLVSLLISAVLFLSAKTCGEWVYWRLRTACFGALNATWDGGAHAMRTTGKASVKAAKWSSIRGARAVGNGSKWLVHKSTAAFDV